MSSTPIPRSSSSVARLVQCALLAALTAVATLISIPIFGGHGFVNPGDAVIHFSVYALGGWYAVSAAAIGSALADIMTGYLIYAPATFIIKGLTALAGVRLIKRTKHPQAAFFISGIIMPIGYFLYELPVLSPSAALVDIPWNLIQYAVCALLGSVLVLILTRSGFKRR
ncbi:MAG: ECF transporter S component [Clostridia bacterium]|nr:ECF transporter S component [Clostridia bacterium]